jgi:hypothetical protein
MPTLDQVSKRVFSDSSWLIKCLIGGFLCVIPIANVWSLGVFYRLADQGRRGEEVHLPEWDDWARLFIEGLQFLLILIVLGILPIAIGVLISVPLQPFLGPLARLSIVPGLILSAPLTAVGTYAFQRNNNLREAFQIKSLLRMLQASWSALVAPTLAFLGAVAVGWVALPLLPFLFFIAGVVVSYFYGATFREIELAAHRLGEF